MAPHAGVVQWQRRSERGHGVPGLYAVHFCHGRIGWTPRRHNDVRGEHAPKDIPAAVSTRCRKGARKRIRNDAHTAV